jgi:ParB-like chromosome segregation protein Spo0J
MTEATAAQLFPTPDRSLYSARVRLALIEEQPVVAAKSKTRRSIEHFGQLTHPLVQEIYPSGQEPLDAPHRYRVVDGARRIADMRAIYGPEGLVDVHVVPYAAGDAAAAAMALALNFNRAANPLAEADHFHTLREHGFDLGEIASQLGITPSKVQRRLLLIDHLHPGLQALLRSGEMLVSAAEACARLSFARQEQILLRHRETGQPVNPKLISEAKRALRQNSLPVPLLEPIEASPVRVDALRDAVLLIAEDMHLQGDHAGLAALLDAYPQYLSPEAPDADR